MSIFYNIFDVQRFCSCPKWTLVAAKLLILALCSFLFLFENCRTGEMTPLQSQELTSCINTSCLCTFVLWELHVQGLFFTVQNTNRLEWLIQDPTAEHGEAPVRLVLRRRVTGSLKTKTRAAI